MHRSHFADRVRAFLLAAALVSALICPQALAADAAGSGGCAHGHTLTTSAAESPCARSAGRQSTSGPRSTPAG